MSALGQIGLVTMGEAAGMVFCGWILRQGALRDQQRQSPWLGLRHRQDWVKFPYSGSMGTICPGSDPEITGLIIDIMFQTQTTEHSPVTQEAV